MDTVMAPKKLEDMTPMMRQYFEVKEKYTDCILFYRLGDFYEMFFDDAKTASRELELTLTGRACGDNERAPMCGVPFHSYETYAARLINKGYKVAICEQTEDPAKAKGLVSREVIRILTPGTVMESSMLPEAANNYICAVYADSQSAGICFADVTTGEVQATSIPAGPDTETVLLDEIDRFAPREALLSDGAVMYRGLTAALENSGCRWESAGEWRFLEAEAAERVRGQLGETEILDDSCACRTVSGLITYIAETQKAFTASLNRGILYSRESFMRLDHTARRNLELFETLRSHEKKGSLLWVLDETATAMGKRCLKQWMEKPLLNPVAIRRRLNAVGVLAEDTVAREELCLALNGITDMERLIGRVSVGTANARDLLSLAGAAGRIPGVKALVSRLAGEMWTQLSGELDELRDVCELIGSAIAEDAPVVLHDGKLLRPGYNAEVDELREMVHNGRGIIAGIEAREKERTGIRTLKVGYNKVFGYYIEVSRANADLVPEDYIRKQTLVNGERYITDELKTLESRILGAQERITGLEFELFTQVREQVALTADRIRQTARAVAQTDVLLSFARVASDNHYCMPEVDDSDVIRITGGRHPVVEQMLGSRGFVANDTLLNCGDDRVALITGPNMAGKSTYMRQTALITLMAQIGSFVPADAAQIGIVDRIYTRIGASDDLASGQSTFMVEMSEVADIITGATSRSLLILDEIGRGTSTYDGMSIARAVLEYCADKRKLGAKTMFATHYHELTELADLIEGVKNYATAVKKRGDDITFLRRIIPGGADDSYGIEVAKLAGVPDPVIRRAKEVLHALESGGQVRTVGRQKRNADQGMLADLGAMELAERIRGLHLDDLTPMQALNLLYELKTVAERLV